VQSTRQMGEEVSCERRYYLCSLKDTEQLAQAIRNHWATRELTALGAGCAVW
jgi:predicted transposase YbfD/YdcC